MKKKNYNLNCDHLGVTNIIKIGEYVYCNKDGFEFKIGMRAWPPIKLQVRHCLTPTEYFKYLVILKHGNIYNLNKTIYNGEHTEVTAECPIHGEFTIAARYLKSKRGCPKCGRKISVDSKRILNCEFINRLKSVHGDLYDYSKTEYIDYYTPVELECRLHGIFSLLPQSIYNGSGCPVCTKINISNRYKTDPEIALKRLTELYGDYISYPHFKYNGVSSNITYVCNIHGIQEQPYYNHLKDGCKKCSSEDDTRFKDGFISKATRNGNALLYLIRCYNDSEDFYKIGITTVGVNSRFPSKSSMPYKYEVLHEYHDSPEIIWEIEKNMHATFSESSYIPLIRFCGFTECFKSIDFEKYLKFLSGT